MPNACHQNVQQCRTVRVVSNFRCAVEETCALLECYATYGGNSVRTFWDGISVAFWRVKKSNFLTPADDTDSLSRNETSVRNYVTPQKSADPAVGCLPNGDKEGLSRLSTLVAYVCHANYDVTWHVARGSQIPKLLFFRKSDLCLQWPAAGVKNCKGYCRLLSVDKHFQTKCKSLYRHTT